MNSSISLIHITTKNNLLNILKDEYIQPFESVRGKGAYMIIKINNDLIKERPILKMFGKYIIEIDQNILLNRNDYIIYEAYKETNDEIFGGKLVYDSHKKERNSLYKVIKNLTLLNEIKFDNKISLKKYIPNIYEINMVTNNLIPISNI